jgi:hypothetical protein
MHAVLDHLETEAARQRLGCFKVDRDPEGVLEDQCLGSWRNLAPVYRMAFATTT